MPVAIDLGALGLRKVAPQHEHDAFALAIHNFNDAIREGLPATERMGVRFTLLHRQSSNV